jgi:hypothetical protein
MHIGNAILCIADRGCLLLFTMQQLSPPRCFQFIGSAFQHCLFFEKEIMRALCAHDPTVSLVLSVLISSNSLWQCIMPKRW